MNKIKVNKSNILKLLVSLGIGGSVYGFIVKSGPYINPDTGNIDFYYLNTKNIHLSNEELLDKVDDIFYSSDILQSEWEDVYPILSNFILKYGDKLDQEELLDTLTTLKFEYENGFKNRIPLGMYDFENNSILYDDIIDKMNEKEALEIRTHEALHFLFHQHFSADPFNVLGMGLQLDEGMVTELTREYGLYSDDNVYYKNTLYLKSICEIVGEDKYLECLGKHSLFELLKSLSQYGTYLDSISLIMNIDKACSYYDNNNTEYDKKAWDIINKMYYNKYGVSIKESDNEYMKGYSNYFVDNNCNTKVEDLFGKSYFINRDKNKAL